LLLLNIACRTVPVLLCVIGIDVLHHSPYLVYQHNIIMALSAHLCADVQSIKLLTRSVLTL